MTILDLNIWDWMVAHGLVVVISLLIVPLLMNIGYVEFIPVAFIGGFFGIFLMSRAMRKIEQNIKGE